MKIAFYGGQTVGIITLLTLLSKKHEIFCVIPEDEGLGEIAKFFKLTVAQKSQLDETNFTFQLSKNVNLFICCHGKKILQKNLLENVKCINIHPCLYRYKGAGPIERLIADGNPRASVATHWMSEKVDDGEVIVELFKTIENIKQKNEMEVYTLLYPLYIKTIIMTLQKIGKKI